MGWVELYRQDRTTRSVLGQNDRLLWSAQLMNVLNPSVNMLKEQIYISEQRKTQWFIS